MAIVQKKENVNGKVLIHTYSDNKKKIKCGNNVYTDAYDVHEYTYTETDEDIMEDNASEITVLKAEIAKLKAEQATQNEAIEAGAEGLTDVINTMMGSE